MSISAFGADDKNNDNFEEAVVRLHAAPIDQNKFIIDPSIGDRLAPSTAEERNRAVHNALGHISENKMHATSAVVDGMPKYSKCPTFCTSCHKGKMHILPHDHNKWI